MKPIDFKGANCILERPGTMTEAECGRLPIYRMPGGICVSCWRPTLREILSAIFRRRVWLWIWSGPTQPPVYLGTTPPSME